MTSTQSKSDSDICESEFCIWSSIALNGLITSDIFVPFLLSMRQRVDGGNVVSWTKSYTKIAILANDYGTEGKVMEQSKGNIILYQTVDGTANIEVTLANDTVWLTADQMAELFQQDRSTIQRHIRSIYQDNELS